MAKWPTVGGIDVSEAGCSARARPRIDRIGPALLVACLGLLPSLAWADTARRGWQENVGGRSRTHDFRRLGFRPAQASWGLFGRPWQLSTDVRPPEIRLWTQAAVRAAEAPEVQVLLRSSGVRGAKYAQPRGQLRLQIEAQRLQAPYEGLVQAGVLQQWGTLAVHAAFAGIDAELPPLRVPRVLQTKRLRRSGFVAGMRFGRLKQGGLSPLLAADRPLTLAYRLEARGQLWLRRTETPHLDGRLGADVVVPLRPNRSNRPARVALWGRGLIRRIAHTGMDRPLVRLGDVRARLGVGRPPPVPLLGESVLGHEDLAAYGGRMAVGEAGLVWRAGAHGRLGAFVAAAHLGAAAGARGHVEAAGAVAQVAVSLWGLPLALRYQVAARRGSQQGAWLHLLTAGA